MADGHCSRRIAELQAGGPDDLDGMHAASVLAAYFAAEHAQAFRCLMWPRLTVIAAVAWLLQAVTLLPPAAAATTFLVCGAVAALSLAAEWRSQKKLRTLLHPGTNS